MFTANVLLDLAIPFLFAVVSVLGLVIGVCLYLRSEYESKIKAIKDVSKTSTPF